MLDACIWSWTIAFAKNGREGTVHSKSDHILQRKMT